MKITIEAGAKEIAAFLLDIETQHKYSSGLNVEMMGASKDVDSGQKVIGNSFSTNR